MTRTLDFGHVGTARYSKGMGVSRNLANKQHIMAIVRGSMMIGQWVLHRSKYESLEGHRIV